MVETIAILLAALALAGVLWLTGEVRVLRAELAHVKEVRTPVRAREEPAFVPEEEAWPEEIRNALARYPVELAEPTRQWIRQQRRLRVGWGQIRRQVLSNPENAVTNTWSHEHG